MTLALQNGYLTFVQLSKKGLTERKNNAGHQHNHHEIIYFFFELNHEIIYMIKKLN